MRAWSRTPTGRKLVRYSTVSIISIVISQVVLFITFGALRLWSAVVCNIVATAVAAGPSYYLNRRWAWGKSGRSHLVKEVLPFWGLAFAGLALSVWAVHLTEDHAHQLTSSHFLTSLMVNAASLAAFGVIWIGKFLIFNRLMFIDRSPSAADPESAAGLSGVKGAQRTASGTTGPSGTTDLSGKMGPSNGDKKDRGGVAEIPLPT